LVTSLNTQAGKQAVFVVPVGQAVLALREKIIKGEAPGIAKQSDLFTDPLGHPRGHIQALATYCHFAVIYRQSPVGLPCPAPLAKGPGGEALNTLLQQRLTPARDGQPERRVGGRVFRIGDKVTQIRNNYDKGQAGVFNGTLGVVTALDTDEQTLTVRTDEDEHIDYDFDELDELAHAYAMTIHRSQGSEYPAVVIPVTTSAWMMLQRNLLYTAITRAKQLVVLVGSRRALAAAIRTVSAGRRHTALTHRLT